MSTEIVLVTGGSGFIGQHIIKQLLAERENLGISEVRSVDLLPFRDQIGSNATAKGLRTFVGDICQPDVVDAAFQGVNCVFHCAGLVNLEYPPNYEELQQRNVEATRIVVELCAKHNIQRLIYTSCASVCIVPFKGSTFQIIINQTESKAATPKYTGQDIIEFDKLFLIPGYSSSKLRAETLVLNSNGVPLRNNTDFLSTTALRPPLTYGEGDHYFMPNVLDYLSKHNYVYPRIAGAGGKQQLSYAGNIAWAHLCAYKTLKTTPKAIAGLPVFVNDDTQINDISRFIQKNAILGKKFKVNLSFWYLPHFLFFFLSFLLEMFVKLLYPITKYRLSFSLRAISSFTASVLMFNRLRAEIHMDYAPIFSADESMQLSANWYMKRWTGKIGKK